MNEFNAANVKCVCAFVCFVVYGAADGDVLVGVKYGVGGFFVVQYVSYALWVGWRTYDETLRSFLFVVMVRCPVCLGVAVMVATVRVGWVCIGVW